VLFEIEQSKGIGVQAVRRQILAHCPLQLRRLDSKQVTQAEGRLMALTHNSRPTSAWSDIQPPTHAPPKKHEPRFSAPQNATVSRGMSSGKLRVARGSGGQASRNKADRAPVEVGGQPANWQPGFELRAGSLLLIQGDALHALTVRPQATADNHSLQALLNTI
jgi:hypothetical protein